MRQPRRSAAESSAIRASHEEFINQVLKAPIEAFPPSSLPMYSESLTSNTSEFRWESRMVQNLFNHLGLIELASTKGYRAYWIDWMPSHRNSLGPNVVSALQRFVSANEEVAFDVHGYITSDLELLGAGILDPKTIVLNRAILIMAVSPSTEMYL